MSKVSVQIKLKELYFISFIEGGVVMVTEIAGAKILTPFFGASLYSWASTLSITLLALMSGYYTGGYATTKNKFASVDKILWVFLLSGLLVLLMPSLGEFIMKKTISFSFFSGLIISQLFFLFLPIFLMGMISPMIILQITTKAELAGRSAGNIYAVSTFGGILFTLCFGFLIIPHFGISFPLKVLGLSVTLIGMSLLVKLKLSTKTRPFALMLTLIATAVAFHQLGSGNNFSTSKLKILASSEGLLGELKVIDQITYPPSGEPVLVRKLRTNNIEQNYVFANMPSQSLMYYVNFTRQLLRCLPKKENALLIGLGAGSLYSVLADQNIQVESVEIDKRIYDLGVKYFALPVHNNVITDGRYFINVCQKKYDLILLDVIIGESVPAQLITLESFRKLYELLNTNGHLIIEHGGVHSFADNSFIPSIVKTLHAAGFQVALFNPLQTTSFGDVLFVAGKNSLKTDSLKIGPDVFIKGGALNDYSLSLNLFNSKDAGILTDDKNNADLLLKAHYFKVRQLIRKELALAKN